MAIKSGFFNSINGDRKYDAKRFAEYFASFIGNGVFPNPSTGLQAMANNDMTVTVNPGKAWINGYFLVNDDDYILQIDTADGVLNRIDKIIVRYDITDREIRLEVKKGGFASNPVAPELQRDADAYELALCDIQVNAGVISITSANITDLRNDKELCGKIESLIAGDISALANEIDQISVLMAELEQDLSGHEIAADPHTQYALDSDMNSHVGAGGTAHAAATTVANGFMSAADKTKINGIEANANNYVHPGSGTNPHGTTKADVELGSVANYGIATQVDAQAGTSSVKYMTPLRTKEAIESLAENRGWQKIGELPIIGATSFVIDNLQSFQEVMLVYENLEANTVNSSSSLYLYVDAKTGGPTYASLQGTYQNNSSTIYPQIFVSKEVGVYTSGILRISIGSDVLTMDHDFYWKSNSALYSSKVLVESKTHLLNKLLGYLGVSDTYRTGKITVYAIPKGV